MSTSSRTETGLTDSARRAYGTSRISDWTRVKMLIALYDAAIANVEQALQQAEAGDETTAITHRLRASQIVFGLEAGLDHKMGEIPQQIDRLCQYVRISLSEGTPDKLRSALRSPLRFCGKAS